MRRKTRSKSLVRFAPYQVGSRIGKSATRSIRSRRLIPLRWIRAGSNGIEAGQYEQVRCWEEGGLLTIVTPLLFAHLPKSAPLIAGGVSRG